MKSTRWALALAIGAIFAAASSRFPAADNDLFWHLASGRWMLDHRAILDVDIFSSTVVGARIPTDQWLGQVVLAGAYALGSWWAVVALRTVAVLAIATLVTWSCLASARPWIAAAVAFPSLVLARIVWTDRPELFGLLCFVVFLLLVRAARAGDRRAAIVLPALFALWVNLHGGFAVGIVLLAAVAVEALRWSPERGRVLVVVLALSCVATVLNPAGLGVYDSPGWHFTDPPRYIQEWTVPDVTTVPGALFALALLATLAVALARGTRETVWLALLPPLTFLGLTAVRHTPLFAIAAAPYVAGELDAFVRERFTTRERARAGRLRGGREVALALTAFALVLAVAAIATAPRDPDLSAYPTRAADALRAERGVLFSEYDWGGYLIWAVPEHPVFIDGRLRPYVPVVLDDYQTAIAARDGWRAVLDRRDVTLVLVRPTSALATRLREAGWALVSSDDVAVLYRR